jgi:hypothetical protein
MSEDACSGGGEATRFSRRTIMAAIEVLDGLSQAEFSRLLRHYGPVCTSRVRGEEVSLKKRLNDLADLLDEDPSTRIDGGDLLRDAIVEKAVSRVPDAPEWAPENEWPPHASLRRALRMDGFDIKGGQLARSLPNDLRLPKAEDEVQVLLKKFGLTTAAGHLREALEAHARGSWSAANGQLRNVLDAIFDGLAEKVDPTAAGLASGQPRRAKLAAAGFISKDLNEWTDDGRGFVNGLMSRLHPHGAHPGLSNEEDSTFRLHTVLLTARLFLKRFEKGNWKT